MRLNWRRSSRVEDRFETWIAKLLQERVLAGETTPIGPHPDEAFLRDLARKAKRIPMSDPRVDHAANCPTCMSRLLEFRGENNFRRRRLVVASAVASCLLIIAAMVSLARNGVRKQSPATNVAVVSETVNLWDAGRLRGEQRGSLQSVSLPAALVRLTIILPRFSTPGQYAVAVTKDQTRNWVVSQSGATATVKGEHETVSVELDLRGARAGAYFLSTVHEQDQASYYYLLQIR